MTPTYTVHYAKELPEVRAAWEDPAWHAADTLTIAAFHPKSSDHRPEVQARFLHDTRSLAAIYRVADRYLLCRHMQYQDEVCLDSCVEFFVRPKADKGYMNFEVNCGGAKLIQYREIAPDAGTPPRVEALPEKLGRMVRVHTSLTGPITEEIEAPTTYTVAFQIPFGIFETYTGALGRISGQVWRANAYKCADRSSHPHWAAWASVGEVLSFHQPERFGLFRLE